MLVNCLPPHQASSQDLIKTDKRQGWTEKVGEGERKKGEETSLVVQWLRLHAPNAGDLGLIPGQGTRSHMLQLRPSTAK